MIGSTALATALHLAAFGAIDAFCPGRPDFKQRVQTCAYFRRDRELAVLKASDDAAIADDGNGDGDSGQMMDIDQLTMSQLFELVDFSFVQALLALSDTGDEEPLKLFIVAVKLAAKRMMSRTESGDDSFLQAIIDSIPQNVKRFDEQEMKLRNTWITAVCLVLDHVVPEEYDGILGGDVSESAITSDAIKTYRPVLKDLVAIYESGLGVNIDNFVESRRDVLGIQTSNVLALEGTPEDNMQLAIVSQTIKVMYNTLIVLDAERAAEALEYLAELEREIGDTKNKRKKPRKGNTSSGGRGFG